MTDLEPGRLSRRVLVTYSLPSLGLGAMGLVFSIYLMKFATDVLLIAPAVMGGLLAVSRLWDAFSDPMAGYWSDRTRLGMGRRRSWMLFAGIPIAIGIIMMWSPPAGLAGLGVVVWMGLSLFIYETSSTAFYVPYGALGVELSEDYHERTRLFAYRHVIMAVGLFFGVGAYGLLVGAEHPRDAAFILSLIGGPIVAALCIYAALRLPERSEYQDRGSKSAYRSIADVFRNPHSRILLVVYFVEAFGLASIAMLVPYFSEYVFGAPELATAIIVLYFVTQLIFTPVWLRLSRRFGKKPLFLGASMVSFFGFALLFFATNVDSLIIWISPPLLGAAGGCAAIVAPSIQADVIDWDEYKTGERKEGAYLAVWNFIRKSASAATALIVGGVLQATEFAPNTEQTEGVQFAIRALIGLLPAFCYLIGIIVFLRFSFNEPEHRAIREILDQRNAARAD
ncbi:MAG: MFS transporter [Myxococcota bacterium]|nr:MFS transporter [Myxococcota bacterium]